jgi:hypothetical protein
VNDCQPLRPRALAVVHGHVRALDQLLRAQSVDRRLGDADAGGDAELLAVHAEAVGEDVQDGIGQLLGTLRLLAAIAHDQELVAAEPAIRPSLPTRALDASRAADASRRSPAAWPSTSLTTLKRSRSM